MWPSDAICRHRSGSTLAQVMAWCHQATSHYLNQCWFIISEISWHSPGGTCRGNMEDIYPWYDFEKYQFKIAATFPRGQWVNSLAPRKFEWNFKSLIFQIISVIDGRVISCELALRWSSLKLTDDKSTLVQVMAWCRQATSHYLSQCWPRSLSPYGVNRPQWVNYMWVWGLALDTGWHSADKIPDGNCYDQHPDMSADSDQRKYN